MSAALGTTLGNSLPATPRQLGRFALIKVLGQGAQGMVHLARDPRLDRQVALKTWKASASGDPRAQIATLMDEARMVSRLAHPNVVTLHDAFEDQGQACLVFEYVPGETLSDLLARNGALAPAKAVRIALDVCRAVAAAHASGIIHRDLKPGNIMLTESGTARVMDFGIARCMRNATPGDQGLVGTPAYMAPEYLASRNAAPSNDLFSLGMVLYEMLAGRPAVQGRSLFETLHRIANETFAPISAQNAACDDKLDSLVMKALEKDPARRFASAGEMEIALKDYLDLTASPDLGQVSNATLEFLLRRMRHKSDFPALTSTLSAINRAVSDEKEPVAVLCNSILKDFALTNKLLKLVNAACFTQYGGDISTISRAVALIGFEGVRNAALSLMLFEHLQNHPQAGALKDEVVATYFAGMLARDLAIGAGLRLGEEAYVCAMFHRLGQLVTAFYLPEEDAAIKRLVAGRDIRLEHAAREVLGMSFEDLGAGVAKSWNFPESILSSMRGMSESTVARNALETEPLRVLSALACELCDCARASDGPAMQKKLDEVQRKFGAATGFDRKRLEAILVNGGEALKTDRELLGFAGTKSIQFPALQSVLESRASSTAGDTIRTTTPALMPDTVIGPADATGLFDTQGGLKPGNRAAVLTAGVQDITNTLVGDYEMFDVMRIILETLYRALGFQRTLLFIREPNGKTLRCRFGFGADAEALSKSRLGIPLAAGQDLFSAALHKGVDICIENLEDARMQSHIPDWYRKTIRARGMVLFPMLLNKRPVGLIYADSAQPQSFGFSTEELNLVKTLRNQAVLALKQRSTA
jgi:eukaryotic-like serine/threonine-protein kinase